MQQSAYGIELTIEQNADGEVTPTVPVTWNITEELVGKLKKKGFTHPHLLIVVASRAPEQFGGYDFEGFRSTQVRLAKLETRREYVSFSRPGTNSVFGVIVNLDSRDAVKRFENFRANPAHAHIGRDGSGITGPGNNDPLGLKKFTRIDVTVPVELFATEPPRWIKNLVEQFYPAKPFDECNFRGRAIVSFLATPFIQFYGLFARLATLIVLVGLLGKRPDWREFIAFNPHDFARSFESGLDDSVWIYKKGGTERTGVIRWVNPPMILAYLFIVAIMGTVLLGVPAIVFGIWSSVLGKGHSIPLNTGQIILLGTGIDVASAIILALIIMVLMIKDGQLQWSDVRSRLAMWTWRKGKTSYSPYTRFATMPMNTAVGDTTVHLRFYALKAKVCRPFAR